MAKISFCKPKYVVIKVDTDVDGNETEDVVGGVKVPGKGINLNVTVNTSDTSLYADDGVAEYDSEFVDGDISLEVDDLSDEAERDYTGCTIGSEGDVLSKSTDNANYIRQGGIIGRIKGNTRQYRAVIYMRVKFGIPADAFATKGETTTFGTSALNGKCFKNRRDEWRYKSKWVETVEAAESILDEKIIMNETPLSAVNA